MLVAIDYFTNWIEVRALATIIAYYVRKFIREDIIYWCDLLYTIISEHNKQFACKVIANLCATFWH